jgi:hypothetical protein
MASVLPLAAMTPSRPRSAKEGPADVGVVAGDQMGGDLRGPVRAELGAGRGEVGARSVAVGAGEAMPSNGIPVAAVTVSV